MKRIAVDSSLAKSIGHGASINNPRLPALEVEMLKGGKVYQYEGVTVEQYNNIMRSESVGKSVLVVMNAKVDGVKVYPCTEITEALLAYQGAQNHLKEVESGK